MKLLHPTTQHKREDGAQQKGRRKAPRNEPAMEHTWSWVGHAHMHDNVPQTSQKLPCNLQLELLVNFPQFSINDPILTQLE